jgi:hypothetical protein
MTNLERLRTESKITLLKFSVYVIVSELMVSASCTQLRTLTFPRIICCIAVTWVELLLNIQWSVYKMHHIFSSEAIAQYGTSKALVVSSTLIFMDPCIAVWLSRNTNKMHLCNRIYYSKVCWRLNMFRSAHRSSSGAINCICSFLFIYPCGDRPLPRLSGKWTRYLDC